MSLLLLVEGDETEPRVYEAWLAHRIPWLSRVANVVNLNSNSYVLVSGQGYPSILGKSRIGKLLEDIDNNPGKVKHFWICVDSDESTLEGRRSEVETAIREAKQNLSLQTTNPSLEIHIIVQHCCIETWFLGHDGFMRAGPQSRALVDCKRFYDVSADDPEQMGKPSGYVTRQSFHLHYLQAMLAERSHRYMKRRPGVILERSYLDALISRSERTNHLASFRRFLEALDAAETAVRK